MKEEIRYQVVSGGLPLKKKLTAPIKIDNAPISQLLDNLKRKEYRIRYWTKQEIRKHPSTKVEQKLDQWLNNLNDKAPNFRHHQLEALLAYANIGIHKEDLVTELINCNVPEARAAAARQIEYWPKNMIDAAEKLIAKCSKDNDEIVKLEAAITCSWLGTEKSFNTLLELGGNDMGKHLNYAVTTALGSESIKQYWSEQDQAVKGILAQAKKKSTQRRKNNTKCK